MTSYCGLNIEMNFLTKWMKLKYCVSKLQRCKTLFFINKMDVALFKPDILA